jgi:hypothetical protein
MGVGAGDILYVHKVLSRKLKAIEQLAHLGLSRKQMASANFGT